MALDYFSIPTEDLSLRDTLSDADIAEIQTAIRASEQRMRDAGTPVRKSPRVLTAYMLRYGAGKTAKLVNGLASYIRAYDDAFDRRALFSVSQDSAVVTVYAPFQSPGARRLRSFEVYSKLVNRLAKAILKDTGMNRPEPYTYEYSASGVETRKRRHSSIKRYNTPTQRLRAVSSRLQTRLTKAGFGPGCSPISRNILITAMRVAETGSSVRVLPMHAVSAAQPDALY